MPMSVRGISERGFTLIEMLVVMVIIGIGATMVTLAIAPGSDRQLRGDAERLVDAFITAQSEARSDGRVILWRADDKGWQFERRARGQTLSTGSNDPVRPDRFERDELLSARSWGQEWPVTLTSQPPLPLAFDTEWIAAPLVLQLQAGADSLTITRNAAGQYEIH